MTISAGFYDSAGGKTAENEIVLATLSAFQKHGINNAVLAEQIEVPGLASGQVSGVINALHEQNILVSQSVKRGYFSLQGFRISEAGEQILLQSQGIKPVDADKAAIMQILKSAAKEDGPCLIQPADIQQERVARLIDGLKTEGMLERASVKRGFYTLDAVAITDHGRQSLSAYEKKIVPKPEDISF